jgi:hypothetical protein
MCKRTAVPDQAKHLQKCTKCAAYRTDAVTKFFNTEGVTHFSNLFTWSQMANSPFNEKGFAMLVTGCLMEQTNKNGRRAVCSNMTTHPVTRNCITTSFWRMKTFPCHHNQHTLLPCNGVTNAVYHIQRNYRESTWHNWRHTLQCTITDDFKHFQKCFQQQEARKKRMSVSECVLCVWERQQIQAKED